MPLKFYFDTHIAKQIAVQLRQRGVEVIRCEEVGMAEASDEEHLIYAAQHGCAMVSMDEDFLGLHDCWQALGLKHAGIFKVSRFLRGKWNIGHIHNELLVYVELVAIEAGSLENDIDNHVLYIG